MFKIIDTFVEADKVYKRGRLYVWTVCPAEFASDPAEYYEPHWHPVTELPEWGPEHFHRYTCGARLR